VAASAARVASDVGTIGGLEGLKTANSIPVLIAQDSAIQAIASRRLNDDAYIWANNERTKHGRRVDTKTHTAHVDFAVVYIFASVPMSTFLTSKFNRCTYTSQRPRHGDCGRGSLLAWGKRWSQSYGK
jgi:hypothetical protein